MSPASPDKPSILPRAIRPGLNQTGEAFGTVANLATTPGIFPPTTVTRVWMVTYYIDVATNAQNPQLIRQVNYPNYPAGAPVNPPPAIADDIENLAFSYAITSSTDPAGTYHRMVLGTPRSRFCRTRPHKFAQSTCSWRAGPKIPTRHEDAPILRNNFSTQVSIRSLSFNNQFNTSATASAP